MAHRYHLGAILTGTERKATYLQIKQRQTFLVRLRQKTINLFENLIIKIQNIAKYVDLMIFCNMHQVKARINQFC